MQIARSSAGFNSICNRQQRPPTASATSSNCLPNRFGNLLQPPAQPLWQPPPTAHSTALAASSNRPLNRFGSLLQPPTHIPGCRSLTVIRRSLGTHVIDTSEQTDLPLLLVSGGVALLWGSWYVLHRTQPWLYSGRLLYGYAALCSVCSLMYWAFSNVHGLGKGVCPPPPPLRDGRPRSSQTGQVIRGLR